MELSSSKPKKLFTIFKKKKKLSYIPGGNFPGLKNKKNSTLKNFLIFLQKIFSPRFRMNTDQAIEGKSSNTPA